MSEAVWLVVGNCGDYYCGCGVGHVLAVALSAPEAAILRDACAKRPRMHRHGGKDSDFGTFATVEVRGPLLPGNLVDTEFQLGLLSEWAPPDDVPPAPATSYIGRKP